MESEPARWSEENQKRLQARLCGMWAEDIWIFMPTNPKYSRCYLRFALTSSSLNVELKYAVWSKLNGRQKKLSGALQRLRSDLNRLLAWLNQLEPPVRSLMDECLVQWEESFHAFLILKGKLHPKKSKHLLSTQQYVDYPCEDRSISLLRQLYKIISEAYDDRPETEKDVWDVRAMGLAPDLLYGANHLNFTPITQPWLRSLAKKYLRYRTGNRSLGTCKRRLSAIVSFSRFLSRQYPTVDASGIDRKVIVRYVSDLNERGLSSHSRYSLLSGLRDFFETCSSRLGLEDLFRETMIVSGDFPKKPEGDSREIPEPVLVKLREQLETLPPTELRMVVILLECGMRIGELCALPFDCLLGDEHGWYLRSYQSKMKQEHLIPLVDDTIVKTIQAQQQEIRTQVGNTCPYLFPRPGSHTRPFGPPAFSRHLNKWALERDIRDAEGNFFRFQAHQFRHTVGMQLLNEDVPIEIIGHLLGHHSYVMTQVYARKRTEKQRDELERLTRRRKTVNYLGQTVTGDARANDPDAQLLRKGIRGQTLAVGGCGRLILNGPCDHANVCLTCQHWLTSTEDLPALKTFHSKALRLRQRAQEAGNPIVMQNQDRIIPILALRIESLKDARVDSLPDNELVNRLQAELAQVEAGLDEAREAGIIAVEKYLERLVEELRAGIAEGKETTDDATQG